MSKDQTTDLLKFLALFDKDVQELALWLREFVWDLYPTKSISSAKRERKSILTKKKK